MDGHHFLTIITILTVVSLASSELYRIVPSHSLNLCEKYTHGKCTSLAEFAKLSGKSENNNLILVYSPGEYSLTQYITITDINNVTLIGDETQPPLINFRGSSGFIMSNISTLSIVNLNMSRSGQTVLNISTADNIRVENCHILGNNPETRHQPNSAVYIKRATAVLIIRTHFQNNHLRYHYPYTQAGMSSANTPKIGSSFVSNVPTLLGGGSIHVIELVKLAILNCKMTNNTAVCDECVQMRGGALFSLELYQLEIINSTFEGNAALTTSKAQLSECCGGAIYTEADAIKISSCQFVGNRADHGGSIYVQRDALISSHNLYGNNNAHIDGGAIHASGHSMVSSNDYYTTNRTKNGASILASVSNMSIVANYFANNDAYYTGGALYVNIDESGFYNSSNNLFINNKVHAYDGGAICVLGSKSVNASYHSSYNSFTNNNANRGGAMHVFLHGNSSYHSLYNNFTNNNANYGGAMHVFFRGNASYHSSYNRFTNNNAAIGGAMDVYLNENASYHSSYNRFTNNNAAAVGGAMDVLCLTENASAYSSYNNFTNNNAVNGGATRLAGVGTYSSMKDIYTMNTAYIGGGMRVINIRTHIRMAHFTSNQASGHGAAIDYLGSGSLEVSDCEISGNHANQGVIYINSGSFLSRNFTCSENNGSLFAIDSQIELSGISTFTNNNGSMGGAITGIQSTINFNKTATVTITGNRATHGGGIFLSESQLVISCTTTITGNTAIYNGGGIYAYQSEILVLSRKVGRVYPRYEVQNLTINDNRAQFGGGASLIASTLKIFPATVTFINNTGVHGGALFLEQNSKIYLYNELTLEEDTNIKNMLEFSDNSADYGGAVYISDSTAAGTLCERNGKTGHKQVLSQTECFMQSLSLAQKSDSRRIFDSLYVHSAIFTNNSASSKGNDVYGGLLDRCTANQFADPRVLNFTGLDYIKAMSTFNITSGIDLTRADLIKHITSDAVQLCYCMDDNTYDCTVMQHQVSVKKGRAFRVSVTAVDHIQNQVESTVLATFSSNSSVGRFKEEQTIKNITSACTELEYNVYSESPQLQINLYADGPCGDKGISKRRVNVKFLPCDCPIGFQPSESTTECKCECDKELNGIIANCSVENETIQLSTNAWIGYVNKSTNNTGFIIYSTCPYDYCLQKPINISLNVPNGADMQCAYNRTKLLCGECEKGYSLVLGTSRCKLCTNEYLSLLVPFTILGVVLVAFILILNMTVATGTIHGLIFYANIVGATQSIFFSSQEANPTIIFISWLNLDFGIQTCFYNGMNSYAKVLLQLAFPSYLIFLTITIIILCEYSQQFAALLGNKNPVATLSTLILLSYSKLARMIIAALQYTYLDYPDGSSKIVWLYDANVPYFQLSHIPRFIIASIIVVLGAVYTILLLFGQWLPHLSNWRIMKWTRHPKYNAFIDAYHAPFSPKHRYWVGLLLFARIVLYLVEALRTEASVTLLSVACIALFLVLMKLTNTRTYKNWILDMIENSFLVNLIVLAVGTYHVRESEGNQLALIGTSTSITFLTFLAILCYHVYNYLLKNTRQWNVLTQVFRRRRANREYQLEPVLQDEPDSDDDNSVVGDVTDPYLNYTGNESIASMEEPRFHDPPIIRSALILDQLREPALDILDPVTDDHYREARWRPPVPAPRPVTSTVIDRPSR